MKFEKRSEIHNLYLKISGTNIMIYRSCQAIAELGWCPYINIGIHNPAIINLLKNSGVLKALVSSTPDEGTRMLYNQDPERIVPFLRIPNQSQKGLLQIDISR